VGSVTYDKGMELICRDDADVEAVRKVMAAYELDAPCELAVQVKPNGTRWLSWAEFDGDHWTQGSEVAIALAPLLMDGSTWEMECEGDVWRFIWLGGRAYEQSVREVLWSNPVALRP